MRHTHVFLTGSNTFCNIEIIAEYFQKLISIQGSSNNGHYTLVHSGLTGAECLATEAAIKLGWSLKHVPIDLKLKHANREQCRKILAKYKPEFVATFHDAQDTKDVYDLHGCKIEMERYRRMSNTRLKAICFC